ncbi:hypothetical protein ACHAXS_010644 [Conticribra weissflogii]
METNVISPTSDGIIAALLAPFFMSLGFFIWDARWTSSGGSAFALNLYKCNVGAIGFAIMAGVRGFSLRSHESLDVFNAANVGFLILSSTLGILVGDILWLEALQLLGAKHVIVVDSLKPFIAAILGRLGLGEVLRPSAWGGMLLTVMGVFIIAWEEQKIVSTSIENDVNGRSNEQENLTISITDRTLPDGGKDSAETSDVNYSANKNDQDIEVQPSCGENNFSNETAEEKNIQVMAESSEPRQIAATENAKSDTAIISNQSIGKKQYRRGYFCAVFNVLADSLGSLLTKKHGVGMTTWSINLIRFGFAGISLLIISLVMKLRRRHSDRVKKTTNTKNKLNVDDKQQETDRTVQMDCVDNTMISVNGKDEKSQSNHPPLWYELPPLAIRGWIQITAGVGLVTFLCPALSNYALFQIALGLAASLSSIGPFYGLLMDWPFTGRRPTFHGFIGVFLTIAGVVILSLWGTS